MKKIILLFLTLGTMLGFYSCEKSGTPVVFDPANITPSVITAPKDGSSMVFTKEDSKSTVLFTWTSAGFGFSTAVDYYVQIDKKGNGFKNAMSVGHAKSVDSLRVVVNDLNNQVLQLEDDPTAPVPMDVSFRVLAIINSHVDTGISKPITVNITPFYIPIRYPQLYVPGAYQGWNPTTADSIGSINSDSHYEGYIYMNVATEFKFTSARDWNHINYGDGGAPGKLSTNGGAGNLSVPEAGFYKFNVDTQKLTWSYLKTTWGLVGDATPGGWNKDTPMTYDPDTQLWSVTLDLKVGDIKFRANGTDDLTYGSDKNNGRLGEGQANIHIAAAGNYTVVLDLSHTIYRYKLIKN